MLITVVANRVAMALLTLAGVAVVVFILLRVVPGDPVAMMISPGAGPADIAALKAHYGLDAPLLVQFWIWIKGVVTGDFGTSITLHVYVTEVLAARLPATLELAILALIVAVLFGGAVAVAGTLMRRTIGETMIDGLNSILLAVPDFIWALALVLLFAVAIPVLPLTGRIDPELAEGFTTRFYLAESVLTGRLAVAADIMSHMAMPTVALANFLLGIVLAIQGAGQFAKLGATDLVANLVAFSILRQPDQIGQHVRERITGHRAVRAALHLEIQEQAAIAG